MASLGTAAPAAAIDVSLASSDVFVERTETGADGQARQVLAPPRQVSPGDRLLFVLSYRNVGTKPAAEFAITNPVPFAVAFAQAEDPDAEVSVDGGRSWGRLPDLRIAVRGGGSREARAEDVTHIRWLVDEPVGSGETRTLSYHGIAR